MRKLWIALLICVGIFSGTAIVAQDSTSTDSNVTIFVVICETQAVVNFNGTMQAGYDIYYQVFSGAGGTGTALTSLRQLSVSGTYAISEAVTYDLSAKVEAGGVGSARVIIAVEGRSSSTIYDTTVNDVQDGCADPLFQTGSSTDAGDSSTNVPSTPIRSPFGGYLNPDYSPQEEELVVIGPRDTATPRQGTPGLVFAECDQYPIANPGLIYDTDNVVVFWSWFARTPEQVQDHIDNAIYEVGIFDSQPFQQPVVRSEIVQRGVNYWVFYTITLGNARPGNYPIEFKLSWKQAISDGYDDYGPGTSNERVNSTCTFRVVGNPEGKVVSHQFP